MTKVLLAGPAWLGVILTGLVAGAALWEVLHLL
jgi:hypothetical protein